MASEQLDGVVDRITYRNDESTYTVIQLALESGGKATAVGNLPIIQPGERLRVVGEWRVHPRFGVQFHINEHEAIPPATTQAIERYLASGLVKGVGPDTASRLVAAFQERTLEVIADEPHRLTEVPGIGPKRAAAIAAAASQQDDMRRVVLFLQELGVSVAYSLRIFRQYGAKAIAVVRDNPYRLADDVHGIGFKRADEIARTLGIGQDAPERAEAAIRHVLVEATNEGHVYLPRDVVQQRCDELGVPSERIPEALSRLQRANRIVEEVVGVEQRIYMTSLHRAETAVATYLERLLSHADSAEHVSAEIPLFTELDVQLSDEQLRAVKGAVTYGCMVITGGPGTGKTTVVRAICRAFAELNWTFELAAPTGRAAQRLSEATGRTARTLHRLLEVRHSEGTTGAPAFGRNEDKPLDVEAVIVDEASMVDVVLMQHLLAALRPGTRLLLIGDEDQLASVGPGQVLGDILASGRVPVVQLTQVFRQAAVSLIVENAHRIRRGEVPQSGKSDQDFFFLEAAPDAIPGQIIELVGKRLPSYFGGDPVSDIQVLTPVRRGPLGVDALNRLLQTELNGAPGPEVVIGERIIRPRDKVMQIQNNYDTMVFNGDIGRVMRVLPTDRTVEVAFPESGGERLVRYEESDLGQLVHAYAISVHKSQGSEYPCVVMPIAWVMPALMTRNLLYTAITRARQLVVLIGDRGALAAYVRNRRAMQRHTGLKERLAGSHILP